LRKWNVWADQIDADQFRVEANDVKEAARKARELWLERNRDELYMIIDEVKAE